MTTNNDPRFIILEDNICYDNDDYGVWGAVLYDIENGKIFTTRYGHGTDMDRTGTTTLENALDLGLVTCKQMIDTMFAALGIGFHNANIVGWAAKHTADNPLGISVKVTGGRKFKGDGYLIAATEEPVRYGLGAYRNEVNHKYLIYSAEKNDYFIINAYAYMEFSDEFISAYNKACRDNIENTIGNVYSLAHAWAYGMSYASCDTYNRKALIERYSNGGRSAHSVPDVVMKATEEYIERRNIKREAKMAEELPALIDWVRSKGYKNTEEEIIEEAKRIWRKRN